MRSTKFTCGYRIGSEFKVPGNFETDDARVSFNEKTAPVEKIIPRKDGGFDYVLKVEGTVEILGSTSNIKKGTFRKACTDHDHVVSLEGTVQKDGQRKIALDNIIVRNEGLALKNEGSHDFETQLETGIVSSNCCRFLKSMRRFGAFLTERMKKLLKKAETENATSSQQSRGIASFPRSKHTTSQPHPEDVSTTETAFNPSTLVTDSSIMNNDGKTLRPTQRLPLRSTFPTQNLTSTTTPQGSSPFGFETPVQASAASKTPGAPTKLEASSVFETPVQASAASKMPGAPTKVSAQRGLTLPTQHHTSTTLKPTGTPSSMGTISSTDAVASPGQNDTNTRPNDQR